MCWCLREPYGCKINNGHTSILRAQSSHFLNLFKSNSIFGQLDGSLWTVLIKKRVKIHPEMDVQRSQGGVRRKCSNDKMNEVGRSPPQNTTYEARQNSETTSQHSGNQPQPITNWWVFPCEKYWTSGGSSTAQAHVVSAGSGSHPLTASSPVQQFNCEGGLRKPTASPPPPVQDHEIQSTGSGNPISRRTQRPEALLAWSYEAGQARHQPTSWDLTGSSGRWENDSALDELSTDIPGWAEILRMHRRH